MALDGGMSCVKYLMFCFNLLFAISGLIILSVGAWIHHNMNDFVEWLDIGFISSPIIFMVVGVFIFVVAFFGCCGAAKENHCMIMTFSVLLLAIFTVEVGVGITGYVTHRKLEGILSQRLNHSVQVYHDRPDIQKAFDMLQTELHCCGVNGAQDWNSTPSIPESCCASGLAVIDGVTEKCTSNSSNIHKDGCLPALLQFLQSKAVVLGGVGFGIAIVQLLGVMYACCLAKSIRREYETV